MTRAGWAWRLVSLAGVLLMLVGFITLVFLALGYDLVPR